MICSKCREDKPARLFSKTADPARRYRCKECTREQAKRSIRTRVMLPRFAKLIQKWPERQLKTETDWLLEKLTAIAAERRRREKEIAD